MLEVSKKVIQKSFERPKIEDIKVRRFKKTTTYNEKNQMVVERVPEEVNITRLVNEQKKTIKQNRARELLEEINKIYTK